MTISCALIGKMESSCLRLVDNTMICKLVGTVKVEACHTNILLVGLKATPNQLVHSPAHKACGQVVE